VVDARVVALREEHEELLDALGREDVVADRSRLRAVSRRIQELERVLAAADALERAEADRRAAEELVAETEGEEREAARVELRQAEERVAAAREELEARLVPPDPNEQRDVIVEIRGAEGGEEANLFARDLYEMYLRFAERLGWTVEPLSSSPSERGGLNDVTFALRGSGVWTRMRHEAGTHRVQRVPVTESQGRIHTSSATVVVLPEADEVDVEIDPADLRIDVFRSTGPGGQSVNTTDSAVRITHLPSGIVVSMQDEKSQIQNRAKALTVLRSRLLQLEQERQAQAEAAVRRAQVGGGGRAEKIRTYNFPQNRVTDHRVQLSVHKLDRVLAGELEEISDALVAAERRRRAEAARPPAGVLAPESRAGSGGGDDHR